MRAANPTDSSPAKDAVVDQDSANVYVDQDETGRARMVKTFAGAAPAREFDLLLSLDHLGIPRVLDCGVTRGRFWFSQEFVDGLSLQDGGLSLRQERDIAACAAHALLYLHRCGLVHGDVHPGNILVARTGFPSRLVDLGLAGSPGREAGGRPGCIAPEVVRSKKATPEGDSWALAATLRASGFGLSTPVSRFIRAALTPATDNRLRALRELADTYPIPHSIPRWTRNEPGIRDLFSRLRKPAGSFCLNVCAPSGMGKTTLLDKIFLHGRARGWHLVRRDAAQGVAGLASAALRAPRPLLLLVDAADAAGAPVLAAIRKVADWVVSRTDGPIALIAASTRKLDWPGEHLTLEPVPREELWKLVHQITGLDESEIEKARVLEQCPSRSPAEVSRAAQALVSTRGIRLRMDRWRLEPRAVRLFLRAPNNLPTGGDRLTRAQLLAAAAAFLGAGRLSAADVARAAEVDSEAVLRLVNRGILGSRDGALSCIDPDFGAHALRVHPPARRARLRRRAALLAAGTDRDFLARAFLENRDLRRGPTLALQAFDEHCRHGRSVRADELMQFALERVPETHPLRWKIEFFRARSRAAERVDEAQARDAEKRCRAANDDAARQSWAVLAIWVWSRLGRDTDRDRAIAEFSIVPGMAERLHVREALVAIRAGNLDRAEGCLNRLAGPSAEASASRGYLQWQRGNLRGAARSFASSARQSRKAPQRDTYLVALANLCSVLQLTGGHRRATRLLELEEGRIRLEGVESELLQILGPLAAARLASGRMALAGASLDEYQALAELVELDRKRRHTDGGLRALLLRFQGQPDLALDAIGVDGTHAARSAQGWLALPKVLALFDLARLERASKFTTDSAAALRKAGDASGARWMEAFQDEIALRRGGVPAAGRPAAPAEEVLLRGWCESIALRADLVSGRTEAIESRLSVIQGLPACHALLGTEAVVRSALDLARNGMRTYARALLRGVPDVLESPMLQVVLSIAHAASDASATGAVTVLEQTYPLLSRIGPHDRMDWMHLAGSVAAAAGQTRKAENWNRMLELEKKNSPEWRPPAGTRDWRSEAVSAEKDLVVSQARQIRDIVRDINADLNVDRVLERVLTGALSISQAQRGFIVLVENDVPVFKTGRNHRDETLTQADEYSTTVSRRVIDKNQLFVSGDAVIDERLSNSKSLKRLNTRSVLCLPFRILGRTIGTFYLDHEDRPDLFDGGTIETLQTLADLAAVAIRNASLYEQSEKNRKSLEHEASALKRRLEEVSADTAEAGLRRPYTQIVGRGTAMTRALRDLDRAADLDLPVLIEGDTGSGKELFARSLHGASARAAAPFVAENCAAISPGLLESELFGHVKGAFTGAVGEHDGLFRRAKGGTLFLDEIGELPKEHQAKLLRVLEEGEVRPVGSDQVVPVRCRVVVATNRSLSSLVEALHFRPDLYYRLAALRIQIPPLRDRVEDIPFLVRRFLSRHEAEIEPEALRMLMETEWPGNVRQLRNDIAVLAAPSGGRVTAEMVRVHLDKVRERDAGQFADGLEKSVSRFREQRVRAALAATNGEITKAAQKLQLTYQGLRRLIRIYRLTWRSRGGQDRQI